MRAPTDTPTMDAHDLEALRELAEQVATDAAVVARTRPAEVAVADTKSSRTDVVTEMDRRVQDQLVAALSAARPGDGILGEEDASVSGTTGLTWVLDPIDGTVNYLYGIAAYAVSVAVVTGDPTRDGAWTPVAGAVVDASTGEAFSARAGGGARRRLPGKAARPLAASSQSDLALGLVATGFGYAASVRERQAAVLLDVLPRVRDIRRFGSAALDLCRVAAAEVDAYYETGLNPWDLAAGWLIAAEAGCVIGGLAPGSAPAAALTWACAPGLDPAFPDLIRPLTARHHLDAN